MVMAASALLFDDEYYLGKNPDVLRANIPALDHFINHGAAEGRPYKSDYNLTALASEFKARIAEEPTLTFAEFVSKKNLLAYKRHEKVEEYIVNIINESEKKIDYADKYLSTFSPPLHRYNFKLETSVRRRITLVAPTFSDAGIFGGIQTALDFMSFLISVYGEHYNFRLIAQNDATFGSQIKDFARRRGFEFGGEDRSAQRVIVSGAKRADEQLPLGHDEILISTFWATAFALQGGLQLLDNHNVKLCSFVQDYEPNFYPANSLGYMCLQSLTASSVNLMVVNSNSLREFLEANIEIPSPLVSFTPRLNSSLRQPKSKDASRVTATDISKNIILFYARSNPRNLFEVGRLVLTKFATKHSKLAQQFMVIGVGEISGQVPIMADFNLTCLGKLKMHDYAGWMARARVGLSLMMAPHPSYPPLEMAHNGLLVVTNDFKTKRMGDVHDNIVSAPRIDVAELADLLAVQCQRALSEPRNVGAPFKGFLTGFDSATTPFYHFLDNKDFRAIFDFQ